MPFLDLRDLVAGILTIIFISIGLGQFDNLREFAMKEAIKDLKGWPAYHFFPKNYEAKTAKTHAY